MINKVVGVMAVHGREKIAEMAVNRLKERQCLPIEMVLVGDSDVERNIAEKTNSHYVQTPNLPLSKKWQRGIQAARELEPDAVLIMGSDDWITDGWLAQAIKCHEMHGTDLVGKMEWEICLVAPDRITIIHQEFVDVRKYRAIGAGRLFSRNILDKLDWKLFIGKRNRGLDLASFERMRNAGGTWLQMLGPKAPRLLLIRCDWTCCNSWEKLTGGLEGISSSKPVPHPMIWMNKYYPDGWEKLRSLVQ